jgi:putative transposase
VDARRGGIRMRADTGGDHRICERRFYQDWRMHLVFGDEDEIVISWVGRRTTIRVPGVRVADDLVERQFSAAAPNVLWVADLIYLRTWEGWLYLAAVQDAFSRMIVGWAMAEHMRAELVVDALKMGLHRRRPDPGLVHHSDLGSQYVSLAFGQQARDAGIAVSMGSRGDA